MDIRQYIDSKRKQVDSALERYLPREEGSLAEHFKAMRYSLFAGGKRVRPILCLAAAESVKNFNDDFPEAVMLTACALECIHTYSLIHDDLPAMDNDDLRRGNPTCHIAFDEATAILAGDALLTLAFQMLSAVEIKDDNQGSQWLTVIRRIAHAAGFQGMVEGQMRDVASEDTILSLDELEKLHSLKTGALIEASIYSGAILSGGSSEQILQLGIYAKNIGLAFQVKDDILNVEGDPKLLGKGVGTDKLRKKTTYPSIMGLEKSKLFAIELVNRAVLALASFDNRSEPLRAIANYIINRKR